MTPAERQRRRRERKPKAPSSARGWITRSRKGYGTSEPYRIAVLKRDAPEIAERLIAGEFRSVRAAERAAGLFVDKTSFEQLMHRWQKTPFEDQERFLCAVLGCTSGELDEFAFNTEAALGPLDQV